MQMGGAAKGDFRVPPAGGEYFSEAGPWGRDA